MNSLIDFINNKSLAEIQEERDKLIQIEEEKRRAWDDAAREYGAAKAARLAADHALEVKETSPIIGAPRTLVQFTKTPLNKGDRDQTGAVLELIRMNNGLKPEQIKKQLEGMGFEVRGYYVNTILQRLKKREMVSARDGKYYAKEEKETAVS